MGECKNCANMDNEYCFACDNGKQSRQTNGDNFRAMTDDELALFLEEVHKKRADFFKRCQRNCLGEDCYECWLEWLRQECEP